MSDTYDLIIKDCAVFDAGFNLKENCAVALRGNKIAALGSSADAASWQGTEILAASGKLLMPGFVDAHTHVNQQLLRGRTADEFPMIWTRFLVPFESSLREDDVTVSTQLACLEMIKAGITAFADAGGVHMDRAAEVTRDCGMRAAIARSTMDQGANIPESMKESSDDQIRHTEDLYRAFHGSGNGRIEIWFGIRQVMTCSPGLVRKTGEKARELKTGIHSHLCEHKDEVSFCLQHYKKRPVEFLEEMGALGPNFIAAHAVLLSEPDISLLAKRDVKIVHCPHANLTSHGFPKTPRLMEAGLSIGLGNDGASGTALDLFEQARILKKGVTAYWGIPVFDPVVLPNAVLLRMISSGGAAAIGKGDCLGEIAAGKLADLVLIDIHQPHLYPSQKPSDTLIAGGSGRDVTDVIIDGKIIMRGREVLTLDEEKILSDSARHMKAVAGRAKYT
ncbi:MAG: amidohydrolase [Treponema sp.]|jgi:5-methylthioadenosine/S-adenosylhomocysteine deaminase|nr:amidohydrolase [Treponema sp.]